MCSTRRLVRFGQIVFQAIGVVTVFYLVLFGFPRNETPTAPAVIVPVVPVGDAQPPPPPVAGCSNAQLAAARALLGAYVEAIEKPGNKYRHGFTAAEYLSFPCTRVDESANLPTRVSTDIVFVMITSSKELARSLAHRQTWADHTTMLMFADVNGTEAGFIAHPEASGPAYGDAQHRTLRGLQYAVKRFPNARWYGMIDDDTFINPDMLEYTLKGLDWRMPVVLGHVVEEAGWGEKTWLGGGAGMFASNAAAHILAASFYSKRGCDFNRYNDMTVGMCAWANQIPLLHFAQFDFHTRERILEYVVANAGWHRVRKDYIILHVVYNYLVNRNRNLTQFVVEYAASHPAAVALLGRESFTPRLWTVSDANPWTPPSLAAP